MPLAVVTKTGASVQVAQDRYVQYDCGCIDEQLATNDSVEWLLAHSRTDPLSRQRLPAGQFLCEKSAREHKRSPEPEQLIVGWIDREVKDFPPDPVEPPELWADDPEIWALVRQTTAHSSALWTVILACGHVEKWLPMSIGSSASCHDTETGRFSEH